MPDPEHDSSSKSIGTHLEGNRDRKRGSPWSPADPVYNVDAPFHLCAPERVHTASDRRVRSTPRAINRLSHNDFDQLAQDWVSVYETDVPGDAFVPIPI